MTEQLSPFDTLKPTIGFMSWCAIVPFVISPFFIWFGLFNEDINVLELLRLYSAVIVSFVAGSVWSGALLIQHGKEAFEFNRKSLMLGAGFIAVLSWLLLFLEAKVGVFISALLFLVLWQIELKTNLAKVYPQWYWTLRTKQTMVIALCLIGIWITLG